MNSFTFLSHEIGVEKKLWSPEACTTNLYMYNGITVWLGAMNNNLMNPYLNIRSVRKFVGNCFIVNLFLYWSEKQNEIDIML